jgi:hypothetical protein
MSGASTTNKQKAPTTWKNRIHNRLPSRVRLWLIRRSDERQLRALEEKFHPLIDAARNAKDAREESSVVSEYLCERDLILHPTYGMEAAFLGRKARKLGIRVPDKPTGTNVFEDENWEQSNYTNDWMLTPEAERKLRNEIREEERAGADEVRKWLTLFFVVVGSIFAFMSYRAKQKQPDPCQVNYYRNDSGACVFANPAVRTAPNAAPQPSPTPKPKKQPPTVKEQTPTIKEQTPTPKAIGSSHAI